jgi:hypothetical protein
MLDLIKAQQTPQFNWYTCLTFLGANGMPDKLIKELMKQPDRIKITFEKGTQDNTGNVAPDQAWSGPKYFLPLTLLDFKSNISTQLAEAKKEDGQTLFKMMCQYFQDMVSLNGPTSLLSDALMRCTAQRKTLMSALGITLRQLLGSQVLVTN